MRKDRGKGEWCWEGKAGHGLGVRGSEGEGLKRRPNTANLKWRQSQGSMNFFEQVYTRSHKVVDPCFRGACDVGSPQSFHWTTAERRPMKRSRTAYVTGNAITGVH